MARTLEFDRAEVVRAARTLFWRVGFEGASIPEIEQATGLSRSSIYNTFGSKRGLFDASVQSYLDELIRPRLAPLQADNVAPDALATYLTGLRHAFENLHSMPATNGCLLINTASTTLAQDEHVNDVIAAYERELHTAIARGIQAATTHTVATLHATDPAPRQGTDPELIADAVTALVIAGFALARVDARAAAQSVASALRLSAATTPAGETIAAEPPSSEHSYV